MIFATFSYKDLSEKDRVILAEAEKAMEKAYSPYSNYKVGACVLTKDGKTYAGANMENGAYSPSICAERSAIAAANAGGDGDKIVAVAVITKSGNGPTDKVSDSAPCGVCRQVISEAGARSKEDIKIIMAPTAKDPVWVTTIKELLPLAFEFKKELL